MIIKTPVRAVIVPRRDRRLGLGRILTDQASSAHERQADGRRGAGNYILQSLFVVSIIEGKGRATMAGKNQHVVPVSTKGGGVEEE